MRTDTSNQQGPTVRHVMEVFQTAYPKTWQKLLRNRLGAINPANLTPAEFSEFTEYVFWAVKQTGIKDPAAFIAFQVQREAEAARGKLGSSVEAADISTEGKSAGREPVTLETSPATASATSPLQRLPALTTAWGATKAEVLSRAKAAIEAGESPHDTAERLAFARKHFHASQREIGRAVGRSGSWVTS